MQNYLYINFKKTNKKILMGTEVLFVSPLKVCLTKRGFDHYKTVIRSINLL